MQALCVRGAWAVTALIAFVVSAAPAAAQQASFAQSIFDLTAAIEGAYGDEGSLIAPAIDRMAAALAGWDRELDVAADDASRRLALARAYADRGRFDAALVQVEAVARVDGRRKDLQIFRGLVLRAAGRGAEATEAFRAAWSLDRRDPVSAYYLIQDANAGGDASAAHEARLVLDAAYKALLNSQTAAALPFARVGLFQSTMPGPPLIPLAAYKDAYSYLARGDYERAIAAFRASSATDPLVTDPAGRSGVLARSVAAMREGRLQDARALLEQSEALGTSSEAHRVLGLIYWAESAYDKSIDHLTIAIQRFTQNERARLALSRVLSSAGRDKEATAALEQTLRVVPDSALAHWWLALSYERENRFADARQEFEAAAAGAVANEGQLHAAVGRSASSAADFPGAIDALTRAVHAQPNDAGLHKLLGGALVQQDRADQAFAEFIAALLINARDAEAHASIGQLYLNAGRDTEAVDALKRATELAPANNDARYALATALVRVGREGEATQHFARVQQSQRQMLDDRRRALSHDVLKEEAALRVAEGNLDSAIGLYEQALSVGPDAAVYGHLADLYSRVGRVPDAARAKAMYEKAMRSARPDGGQR